MEEDDELDYDLMALFEAMKVNLQSKTLSSLVALQEEDKQNVYCLTLDSEMVNATMTFTAELDPDTHAMVGKAEMRVATVLSDPDAAPE